MLLPTSFFFNIAVATVDFSPPLLPPSSPSTLTWEDQRPILPAPLVVLPACISATESFQGRQGRVIDQEGR